MVAQAGTGQQSMNAGELSPELKGRIDIKQYYSAGLRCLNIEPVAQAGFRNMTGTRRVRAVESTSAPRLWRLKQSRDKSFLVAMLPQRVDILLGEDLVGRVGLFTVDALMAREAQLYLEGDTIGIFHQRHRSLRVLRVADRDWQLDYWPYNGIPEENYGAAYPKVPDIWSIWIRWATDDVPTQASIAVTVDGETTSAVTTSTPVHSSNAAVWQEVAARLQEELRALPSLGDGVRVSASFGYNGSQILDVIFGGAFSGEEYQLSAQVVNTSSVSALPSHTQNGRTLAEPLISDARGWPGVVSIVQDRLVYAGMRSRPSGLLMSQTAEYFRVNTKAQRADGAKLEGLRTNSAEEVLQVMGRQYLLVFTDEAEYFATNRTISRTEPSNFVQTGTNGLTRGTEPVEIENRIYFVGQRGGVLFSTAYDDVSTAFVSRQESLLASHLVDDIVMTDIQRGTDDTDAPRLWMLRGDGRLICATIIRDQEITAFFEYDVGAPVRSIGVDADNRLWLVVERDELVYEILEPTSYLFGSVEVTTDADGRTPELPFADVDLWCETADGYTDGPFRALSGRILTGYPSTRMRVGVWVAPRWESMPRVLVTRNDQVVRRPGRVHTVHADLLETASVAIGANGQAPRDVPLLRTSDPVDRPPPLKTQPVTVAGIPGVVQDTTVVVTQKRPGPLRVRHLTFEEKL